MANATMTLEKSGLSAEERETLILKHLPLVKHVLAHIARRLPPHVDREDLLEAGTLGLVSATERFEPTRKVQFHTFAMSRIRGAMLDALRNEDWLPRSARADAERIKSARQNIEQRTGRVVSDDTVAEELGMSRKKVGLLSRAAAQATFCSLDDLPHGTTGENDEAFQARHGTFEMPTERAIFEEEKERMAGAIQELPQNERLVISLYYFEQLPLSQIAEVLGVTDSRVCQIHRMALKKLQRALAEHPIYAMS